jgi:hypothetical protein
MLSKSAQAAITLGAVLTFGCTWPWSRERRNEINLVFEWRNNQILIDATVGGRAGRFIVGSAQPRTVLDRAFARRGGRARVELGDRFATTITPVIGDLGGIADGILGADVWGRSTLVIDYQRQLVILSSDPADPMNGRVHTFDGPPALPITLDGRPARAVVDVALPDTMVVPASPDREPTRRRGSVRLADYDLGSLEFAEGSTSEIRIGNRILARFLLKIDYRRRVVSLWRDPRSA